MNRDQKTNRQRGGASRMLMVVAASATLAATLNFASPAVAGDEPQLDEIFSSTNMLVLGELHGSDQIPAFTLGAVRAALSSDPGPVILGIEVWSGGQRAVEQYLASDGGNAARASLLATPFWAHVNDGRASGAMLALVDGARELITDGAALSVLCFDDKNNPAAQDRDHAMGVFLLNHRAANPGSRYIVLCGNTHARTVVGNRWNAELKPMAWWIDQSSPVVSLNARYSGGTFWACAPDCGVQRFGGFGEVDARGVTLSEQRDGAGYDGVFDVGATTASIPAVDVMEAEVKEKLRLP